MKINSMHPSARTAVFFGPGQPLELCSIPIPPLQAGEILVRNEYTTLCRSDLSTYAGKRREAVPTILGHEVVGRIAEFGPDAVTIDHRGCPLRTGDRISWGIFASDPSSLQARRGIPQKGDGLFKYGHQQLSPEQTLHGGLSEYTILRPHTALAKIDESIPLPVAAILNCAVATMAGAFRLAGPIEGRRVLITGAGMLGVVGCAMAARGGAAEVIALDQIPTRLATARRFGATTTTTFDASPPAFEHAPADVLLECTGDAAVIERGLGWMGIGGVAVWVGAVHPGPAVAISPERVVRQLLSIHGLHNYNGDDFIAAAAFLEASHNAYPFVDLIDDRFSLDEVDAAFAWGVEKGPYRVGVRL